MATSVDTARITYPESDGKPMADNTLQFRWIVTIQGGIDAWFRDHPDVFVAGDLLWYPVEGQPRVNAAPDIMVAFGRPKGDRGSYLQWEEGGIAPQVVFEILSPNNTIAEMMRKFRFYERHGVEEYYLYNPDTGELSGWQRQGEILEDIASMDGWTSPRLGVRFERDGNTLVLYQPDGERFATYVELIAQREQARQDAEQARQDAEQVRQRAERLAARLRDLGMDPEAE
jgi:Uma2 family endonuclease